MNETEFDQFKTIPGEIRYSINLFRKLHQNPPATLFHYTDAIGFKSIIETGELWASHAYYVNDTQELRYATSLIASRFERKLENAPPDSKPLVSKLKNYFLEDTGAWQSVVDPYILCFCENGNLLSQWRAYAANGQGFSIGLDSQTMMDKLQVDQLFASNCKMFRVLYDSREQVEFIDGCIDRLLEVQFKCSEDDLLKFLRISFADIAFCFKHPSFAEEKEWRLVLLAEPRLLPILNVRISQGRLVPYASVSLQESNGKPIYKEIWHGPALNPTNTVRAIGLLLGKIYPNYRDSITINGSDVPLRGL